MNNKETKESYEDKYNAALDVIKGLLDKVAHGYLNGPDSDINKAHKMLKDRTQYQVESIDPTGEIRKDLIRKMDSLLDKEVEAALCKKLGVTKSHLNPVFYATKIKWSDDFYDKSIKYLLFDGSSVMKVGSVKFSVDNGVLRADQEVEVYD